MVNYNIKLEEKTIFITGVAGFIGSNLATRLLRDVEKVKVVGLDILNDYYDVEIKRERLRQIDELKRDFVFIQGDVSDKVIIERIFGEYKPSIVVRSEEHTSELQSPDHLVC